MKTKIWTDPVVDEVHKTREEIAREANYEVRVLARRLQESQKRHGDKLVTQLPRRTEK
jgi:hypothetical protein